MIPEFVALAAFVLMTAAEWLHAQRVRRIAPLAFGPRRKPALWARLAPAGRVLAASALVWGLTTLFLLPPKVNKIGTITESQYRDLLLVLDVSPSMRLEDAGPQGKQTRRRRAADLMKSFFERVPMEFYRTSVIAVYNGAKPVVVRTTDPEVVRNILDDLPMQYAFQSGPTDLFSGLEEALKLARPWRPKGTTLMIVSDGDTIPPTGMPQLPASIGHALVVGIGDTQTGRFIDGHLSRQDASSLRQLAVRLGGAYHNGNEKHLSTDLIRQVTWDDTQGTTDRLTRREYALMACAAGALVLCTLPLLLNLLGTSWRPGVPFRNGNARLRFRAQWNGVRTKPARREREAASG
jgi:Ca-activated chloride channel family protein